MKFEKKAITYIKEGDVVYISDKGSDACEFILNISNLKLENRYSALIYLNKIGYLMDENSYLLEDFIFDFDPELIEEIAFDEEFDNFEEHFGTKPIEVAKILYKAPSASDEVKVFLKMKFGLWNEK